MYVTGDGQAIGGSLTEANRYILFLKNIYMYKKTHAPLINYFFYIVFLKTESSSFF